MAHQRSLAYHQNNRSYHSGDDGDYSPPGEESRCGKGEKAPRKRNSVAVNSLQLEEFPLQATPESEWPYAAPPSTPYASTVPRITTDPDQYALAGGNMLPPPTGSPYSVQGSSRIPAFDGSNTPYTSAQLRPSYPLNYSSGAEAMPSQYGMPAGRHGPSVQLSQAPTPNFSSAELSPNWASLPSNARPLPGNYAFETDVPSGYQSTAMPFVPSNTFTYPTGASESASIFPGMSPLASNLPYSGPSRTLPNRASVQSSLHGTDGSTLEGDGGLDTYSQNLLGRSSISSAARDAINASEGSSSTASSSPSDAHRTSSSGYGSAIYSSHLGANAGAASLTSGDVLRRTSHDSSYTHAASGMHSGQLGTSHLPILSSSYGPQSMHGGFGGQTTPASSIVPGRSALGGLPPDIHHPQPQYSRSQDMPSVLRSTFESASGAPQRRSDSKSKGRKGSGKR